jgi:hypothetical protein
VSILAPRTRRGVDDEKLDKLQCCPLIWVPLVHVLLQSARSGIVEYAIMRASDHGIRARSQLARTRRLRIVSELSSKRSVFQRAALRPTAPLHRCFCGYLPATSVADPKGWVGCSPELDFFSLNYYSLASNPPLIFSFSTKPLLFSHLDVYPRSATGHVHTGLVEK